ncbi:hypothetical protein SAMN05880581_102512 [Paenibacillus sp. RU26A]|nr:hypothetical protein SAMN05880581_102512 [Paenibacillus sp. RU26A]
MEQWYEVKGFKIVIEYVGGERPDVKAALLFVVVPSQMEQYGLLCM